MAAVRVASLSSNGVTDTSSHVSACRTCGSLLPVCPGGCETLARIRDDARGARHTPLRYAWRIENSRLGQQVLKIRFVVYCLFVLSTSLAYEVSSAKLRTTPPPDRKVALSCSLVSLLHFYDPSHADKHHDNSSASCGRITPQRHLPLAAKTRTTRDCTRVVGWGPESTRVYLRSLKPEPRHVTSCPVLACNSRDSSSGDKAQLSLATP